MSTKPVATVAKEFRATGKDATLLRPDSPPAYRRRWNCAPSIRSWARSAAALCALACSLYASVAGAMELELNTEVLQGRISIGADTANRWEQGAYEVWLLRGNVRIQQDRSIARSDEAVLWIEHAQSQGPDQTLVIAYLEGDVQLDIQSPQGNARLSDTSWLGRFSTAYPLQVQVVNPGAEPQTKPAVWHSAVARRDPYHQDPIERTQFTQFDRDVPIVTGAPAGTRRLRAFPRSNVPVRARYFQNGNEWIGIVDSGVNLIIDGIELPTPGGGVEMTSIDILTDRLVVWTSGMNLSELDRGEAVQTGNTPLEIYLEGNIVFRQGDRRVFADRMYYDVNNQVGTVLDAELLTPVPQFQGLVRLKADLLQQTGPNRFFAENGYVTGSRMGEPTYRLQSKNISLVDEQIPVVDPYSGEPVFDPVSGEQLYEHQRLLTGRNNFLYLGNVPVFYWPVVATDADRPVTYIKRITVRNDQIFGTQVNTDWNAYEIFGITNPPEGTEWDFSLDYMSERGPGGGTAFTYQRADDLFFGVPTTYAGFFDAWGLHDRGTDNLGAGRTDIPPPHEFRGRVVARHRQYLPEGYRLTGEFGIISDMNFLEEFFEGEWDEWKDQSTDLELKRLDGLQSYSIYGSARLNDFFTVTEWLPRGDHTAVGVPLLDGWLTWYENTSLAYGRYEIADAPTNPQELATWQVLPWEANVNGERFITRQELDAPFELGAFRFVPYALGELGHWGEALDGEPLQRAYWRTGIRSSIPFWTVDPTVESGLFNVHGLAHKLTLMADLSVADTNRDVTEMAMYDQFDDINITQYRRRFGYLTFNPVTGQVPPEFDPRFYAIRAGIADDVTSTTPELAGDLTSLRLNMENRWQTKRGMPGRRRIVDWIVLDTGIVYFPKEEQNFGEEFGLLDYNARWHVGDKLTLRSTGLFDFFPEGQRLITIGGTLSRPPRGSLLLEFRLLDGPITSETLIAAYSYRMSPKWISNLAASYDFASDTLGQSLTLTRIGESLLVTAGFNANSSKDVVGVSLAVEPRFMARRTAGGGGAQIPVAGLFGLE